MIFLQEARDRDNNFNLIRVVAAFIVLYVHSRTFLGLVSPPTPALGVAIGHIAVHVFFFTSGFLVTGSLFARADIFDFAWARVMRVFPGLWMMLLITVTGLGLFVGTLPASEFFASPTTHEYVLRCATLINGVRYKLPGLFEHNPYPSNVNGSLWTLPIELRLYGYLAAAWVLLALRPSWRAQAFRYGAPLAALILSAVAFAKFTVSGALDSQDAFAALFFQGATLQMWRDRIRLSYARLTVLGAVLGLAAFDKRAFVAIYLLTLGPVVLHAAYLFGGWVREFNRLGDYSYGVYIYAFPIQQSLAALVPGLSLIGMNIYASTLSLAFAVLSWRLVEKPALRRKLALAASTRSVFERLRCATGYLRVRRPA